MDLVIFVLGLGISIMFILIGAWMFISTYQFMAKAEQVTAVVVRIDERDEIWREDGHVHYWLVYEYISSEGLLMQAKQYTSQAKPLPIGTKKIMLVDPDKSKIIRVLGVSDYVFAVLSLSTGVILLCANVLVP